MMTVVLAGGGCATVSPLLYPVQQTQKNDPGGKEGQVTFFVKPIVTTGFTKEEKTIYKVDLSVYFTSFEFTVLNESLYPVHIDPQKIFLIDDDQIKHPSLNSDESASYFRKGEEGKKEGILLISKPYEVLKEELEAIKTLHLYPGTVEPGEKKGGLIFFKKISPDKCNHIRLVAEDFRIGEPEENKEIVFHFSCQPTGFESIR
ncbi:MAG TPA: hypothetical protein VGB26_14010 [Nitrospiria bacterium]